jgi:hypothetical protein
MRSATSWDKRSAGDLEDLIEPLLCALDEFVALTEDLIKLQKGRLVLGVGCGRLGGGGSGCVSTEKIVAFA